jgi:hypothetical protein
MVCARGKSATVDVSCDEGRVACDVIYWSNIIPAQLPLTAS